MAEPLLAYAIVSESEAADYVIRAAQAAPSSGNDLSVFRQVINSVTERVETYCRRPFASRSFVETYDGQGSRWLYLKKLPIISISSARHLDSLDGSELDTFTSSQFRIEKDVGRIARTDGTIFLSGSMNYEVTYLAGFASVPDDVVLAALQLITKAWRDFDKERDDIENISMDGQSVGYNRDAIPKRVKDVLDRWRVPVEAFQC